jgi:preprotein translocase subunit SecD
MDDLPSNEQTIDSEMHNKNIQEEIQSIPTDDRNINIYQGEEIKPQNSTVEDVKENLNGKNLINNNHKPQNHTFEVPSNEKNVKASKTKRNTQSRVAMKDFNNQLYHKKFVQNRERPIVKKTSFFRKKINELKAKKLSQKNPQKRYKRTKGAEIKDLRRKKKLKNDKLKKSKKSPKFKFKDNTLEHTPSMFDLTQGDDPNAYLALHESENIRPIEDFKIDNDKSPKVKAEIDGAKSKLKGVKSKAVRDPLHDEDDLKDINNKTHRVVDRIQNTKSQTPLNIVHNVKPHNIIKLTFSFNKIKK